MAGFAAMLSREVGRSVLDKTGLTGRYDYVLKYVMRAGMPSPPPGPDGAMPAEPEGPTMATAIPEQLGLRLEASKGRVEVYVIDSFAKAPTQNLRIVSRPRQHSGAARRLTLPEGLHGAYHASPGRRGCGLRFGLKFHREKKVMSGYELTVAKNGLKLTESGPEPPPDAAPNPSAVPPGFKMGAAVARPVSDATGLAGKYDYLLKWAFRTGASAPPPSGADGAVPAASDPAGPTFAAIQEQLGLKLESKKVMVDLFVVDQVSKTPTEN